MKNDRMEGPETSQMRGTWAGRQKHSEAPEKVQKGQRAGQPLQRSILD